MKIEVLHCHGSGVVPTLIGAISRSWFTHSAFRVIENGNYYIYEAQAKGIHRIGFEEWKLTYNYNYKVTEHEITTIQYRLMKSKEGVTKYDYRSLLVAQPVYQLTFGLIWIGSRGASSTKEMYCSEFCAWVLDFPKWWTISPKNLYKLCKKC
jgi:hypothetical protein